LHFFSRLGRKVSLSFAHMDNVPFIMQNGHATHFLTLSCFHYIPLNTNERNINHLLLLLFCIPVSHAEPDNN
jgi:hypothetical protein